MSVAVDYTRLFVPDIRTIRVDQPDTGRYCATLDDRLIFPATPNLDTVIRFVRAFAARTPGVRVDEDSVEFWRAERAFGHSVRVGALSERGMTKAELAPAVPVALSPSGPDAPRSESAPDNVVSILGRVEA